ncbi:MAG: hypothetical protein AABZ43_04145, partial [Planctomycetota bacterium]
YIGRLWIVTLQIPLSMFTIKNGYLNWKRSVIGSMEQDFSSGIKAITARQRILELPKLMDTIIWVLLTMYFQMVWLRS